MVGPHFGSNGKDGSELSDRQKNILRNFFGKGVTGRVRGSKIQNILGHKNLTILQLKPISTFKRQLY